MRALIEIAILDSTGAERARMDAETLRAHHRHLPEAETRVLADLVERFNAGNKRHGIEDRLKIIVNK